MLGLMCFLICFAFVAVFVLFVFFLKVKSNQRRENLLRQETPCNLARLWGGQGIKKGEEEWNYTGREE